MAAAGRYALAAGAGLTIGNVPGLRRSGSGRAAMDAAVTGRVDDSDASITSATSDADGRLRASANSSSAARVVDDGDDARLHVAQLLATSLALAPMLSTGPTREWPVAALASLVRRGCCRMPGG